MIQLCYNIKHSGDMLGNLTTQAAAQVEFLLCVILYCFVLYRQINNKL